MLAVGTSSCGGDPEATAAACSPDRRERVDPNDGHLLEGATEPRYVSDPPTSGPHVAGARFEGVVDQPIPRAQQVGALESGQVLLQHDGLAADEVRELEALAVGDVVVAPAEDLQAAVVATAWASKMECDDVDPDALRAFAEDHTGNASGH